MRRTPPANPIWPPGFKPDWLEYPVGLFELVLSGRMPLGAWHFLPGEQAASQHLKLQGTIGRHLAPFAYRQDREDMACFERGKGEQVMIIHDFCGPDWADEGQFASFAEWLDDVEKEADFWARG